MLVVVALVIAGWALLALRRIRRDLLLARGDTSEGSIIESVARHVEQTSTLRGEVAALQAQLKITQRDVSAALRHVAVVRFNAFDDMGGQMSFATAVLDDNGDGLLLTSIHGHTESRTYIKPVTARKADGRISPEETQAIEYARPTQ